MRSNSVSAPLLLACHLKLAILESASIDGMSRGWSIMYDEDFSGPRIDSNSNSSGEWFLTDSGHDFDDIMDDHGRLFVNDYGPAFLEQLDSFATYRKEFSLGQDGWLTASLSRRITNKDKDGPVDVETVAALTTPTLTTERVANGGHYVARLTVPDFTGGVILRNTRPFPGKYRIEYKLKTLDFGGKRDGTYEYDGKINGYSKRGCKTQHPWGEGSWTKGWSGNASAAYCEWQGVREGPYAYNGFYFLSIVDFPNPSPRNLHFWHYHRKVLMDSFAQHPDRIGNGDGTGGKVCDSKTNRYYSYRDSSANMLNVLSHGMPTFEVDQLVSNAQWFFSSCSDGNAEASYQTAAEIQPEMMPDEHYTFAIERNSTGYTLEASGNFTRVGPKTLRFYRPFVVDDVPIWHYNTHAEEYDGQYNGKLRQKGKFGRATWPDQWPKGSSYPDYFVIGDPYTNAYEGTASLTDIRLYTPSPALLERKRNSEEL